ncbi:VWA domain-containing protein [Haloplanus halobius]|uniref:VWA domain-containing protein n=1 Tax=Haloplanus halobius TaxID=2934938 RepID=UPI00200CC03A|nr:VWA domain-containing protein [Haloplanus sp. XH21]
MVANAGGKNPWGIRGEGGDFGDIVGQRELKHALLAVAANDALDGLLVRGEKGTAKSTAVRALADLLPDQRVVADCPYGCPPDDPARQCETCRERSDPPTAERPVPLVTLPLGATRERVVGTLSVADALDGDYEFDPGLLARANRGILYVDEVNLLDDHLVDVLLDAAASGVNRVERDGVSVAHPAAFTLIGTMNPEEGDLRPQLRDRFALQATVTGCADLDQRVEIIDQALGRNEGSGPEDGEHGERLRTARKRLADVNLPPAFTRDIAECCRDAGVEGHRADIAMARAARTFAALDDRPTVIESDVRRAAELALPHRLQSRPFEDAPDPESVVDDHFEDGNDAADDEAGSDGDSDGADGESEAEGGDGTASEDGEPDDAADGGAPEPDGDDEGDERPAGNAPSPASDGGNDEPDDGAGDRSDGEGDESRDEPDDGADDEATPLVPGERRADVGESRAPSLPEMTADDDADGTGRAGARAGTDGAGPRVRTQRAAADRSVDAAASVRAAAARGGDGVESRDLRQSVRAAEASTLVVFAVDASASMRRAMRAAKGTVLELLEDSYQQRDRVGFVAFAGEGADVLLPPTDSVTLAARHLKDLPTGDRTPLPAGLQTASDVIEHADPAASVVVCVTDGRANVADGSPLAATRQAADRLAALGARVVVVDAGEDTRAGVVPELVERTDGYHVPLDALSADAIDAAAGAANKP